MSTCRVVGRAGRSEAREVGMGLKKHPNQVELRVYLQGMGNHLKVLRRELIRSSLDFREVTLGAMWALDGVGPERHPRDQ